MTSAERGDILSRYGLGLLFITAAIIGGNTAVGGLADIPLKLLATGLAMALLLRRKRPTIPLGVLLLCVAIALLFVIQLIPLPAAILNGLQPVLEATFTEPENNTWRPISLTLGATLEAASFTLPVVLLLGAVATLPLHHLIALAPFVLIGAVVNMVVALTQYMLSSGEVTYGWLDYSISVGLFANANHFSALLYASIPLSFAYFIPRRRLLLPFVFTALVIFILALSGSRAGFGLAIAAALFGMTIIGGLAATRGERVPTLLLPGLIVTAVATAGLVSQFVELSSLDVARSQIWHTTLAAAWENGVTGTGFGSFVLAFQSYEPAFAITYNYINHAHNDFLELLLEGGVPTLFVVGGTVGLMALYWWRGRFRLETTCAAMALFLLMAHSMLDYPARTFIIALLTTYLAAILCRGAQTKP
ncbi:MAG: O-antigen ligase family protein [Pseudomonadota bacterium]